jgi:hypothetical protein
MPLNNPPVAIIPDPLIKTTITGTNISGSSVRATSFTGSFSGSYTGDGSGLTGITAVIPDPFTRTTITGTNITGSDFKVTTLSASNITGSDAKLTSVTASFSGSGAGITSLNAGNISAGTLSVERGGTGAGTFAVNALLTGNTTSAFGTITPTSNSGSALVSNGTNWIAVPTSSFGGSGLSITNNTDNYLVTATGTGLNGESNLSFNGTKLILTGNLLLSSSNIGKDNRWLYMQNTSSNGFINTDYRDESSNTILVESGNYYYGLIADADAGELVLYSPKIFLANAGGSTVRLESDKILTITGTNNVTLGSDKTIAIGGKDIAIAVISTGSDDNILITTANTVSSSNIVIAPLAKGNLSLSAGITDGNVNIRSYNGNISINSAQTAEITGSDITLQTIGGTGDINLKGDVFVSVITGSDIFIRTPSTTGDITLEGKTTVISTNQLVHSFVTASINSSTHYLDPNNYSINYIQNTYTSGYVDYYISGSSYGVGHRFTLIVSGANIAYSDVVRAVTTGPYRSQFLTSSDNFSITNKFFSIDFIAVERDLNILGGYYTTTWAILT